MPRKKVWRVIWYKGAADIPAGDYPTKKEAEDALRELVARGNPTPVTPEVTRISPTYENLVEGQILIDQAGDRWLITGIKREGVPARWAYTVKGEKIELTRTRPLGEVERYYKIERPSLPKPEGGNPAFTAKEAKSIGEKLGLDFKRYDVEQFRQGLNVELEHCNVTDCDPILTGKIAQAHLNELPDYYTRLAKMEEGSRMKTEEELDLARTLTKTPKEDLAALYKKITGREPEPGRIPEVKGVNDLLPMPPDEGPPLPRALGIKWPGKK